MGIAVIVVRRVESIRSRVVVGSCILLVTLWLVGCLSRCENVRMRGGLSEFVG
jgi:hypothetical protein